MGAAKRAASGIAAQLLAFYREPATRRPPYLHGDARLPDGLTVFRLALGRVPEGFERFSAAEREELRQAAVAFVRQVCLWERATHYQVLCLEPQASAPAVREHYHLLISLLHPDRQEPGWPANGAQRANQAYAVLGDATQRAEYDAQLAAASGGAHAGARVPQPPEAAPPRRHRRGVSPGGLFKRFAIVAGVLAALFIVQAWWVGGASPQHSLLEQAMPTTGRWVRNVLPDPPRFLTNFSWGERLPPIEQPRRMVALGTWVPAVTPAPAAPAPEASAPTAANVEQAPPPTAVATASAVQPPPLRLAQAPATSPVPAAPSPGSPSRDQVEGLVALLVGFYDAGDAPRLVALFDPDRLGFFAGYRARSTYADFFDATKERRLRMERLSWQPSGALAQARGEAVVVAEYNDGRPRLERRVPVELDIVLRDGQPRIARMVLFPGAS